MLPGVVGEDERERVIAELRRRAAAGRIAPWELEERIRRAREVRTKAGLESLLGGLPISPPTEPPQPPKSLKPPKPPKVRSGPGVARGWRLVAALVAGALSLVLRVASMVTSDDEADRESAAAAAPTTTLPAPSLPVTTDRVVAVPEGEVDPVFLKVGRGAGELTPGLYTHTTVGDCTWERRDFDGRPEERRTAPRLLIEVIEYEQLYSEGCGSWYLYAAPAEPATTVGDGDWLVGSDLPAGRYRSSGPSKGGSCRWDLANGFRHQRWEIVTGGYARGPSEADLPAGYRFTPTDCGTWTLTP